MRGDHAMTIATRWKLEAKWIAFNSEEYKHNRLAVCDLVDDVIEAINGWDGLVLLDTQGSAQYWGRWLVDRIKEVGTQGTIDELVAIAKGIAE